MANTILCERGKPSSGKSILIKKILWEHRDRVISEDNNCISVGFFFNSCGSQLERSSFGLYRILIYDILKKPDRILRKFLLILNEKNVESGCCHVVWHEAELVEFFHSIIHEVQKPAIKIFIDALDEGDDGEAQSVV